MGIKSWLIVGIGTLVAVGAIWVKKKRDAEEFERVQKIIDEVDKQKKTERKNDKPVSGTIAGSDVDDKASEDMNADVENAVRDMGIDVESAQSEVNKNESESAKKDMDKLEALRKEKEENPEAWAKAQEEQKKKDEESWRRKVKKAVEQKNWRRLEDLFDEKYAGGPWHPSPASVFSAACSDGVISSEILKMAEEHFGKLWCYSGD